MRSRRRRLRDAGSVRRAFLEALRPPPNVTVSEWADENRYLSSSASSEPGKWRTSRVPYLRRIMDVFSPSHPAQLIVLQKAARLGGTEALNNVVGAYMHMTPCPILFAQPTEGDAEEWSKDSLDPMLESTEVLKNLVTPDVARRKGNTILHKRFIGGVLYGVGASTAKSFRRRTARVALGDEVDGWPGALDGEGDPVGLMINRTKTFTWNKKNGLCSTPTIKDASRIEKAFQTSSQEFYHVPCPECRHLQRLVWSQLHWTDEGGPESAEYECIACGSCIPHHKKAWMLDEENGATWVATYPERAIIGFQISALYSPWVTWGQLASEWSQAQGDPLQEQVFQNTALGETWDLANGENWDEDGLMKLVETFTQLSPRVACLTAGVDVQDDRLVLQVDGWGPHGERWTILRRDLGGDPADDALWDELEVALLTPFARVGGGSMTIRAAAIDYSGHHSEAVARFCRRNRRRRWWAIIGRSGAGKRAWPVKPTRKNKGRVDLYEVGIDGIKEQCMARLKRSVEAVQRNERGGSGFWHFAAGAWSTRSYFDELTAEVAILEYPRAKKGAPRAAAHRRWVMRPGRSRNEALDCSVYSYAAMQGLLSAGSIVLDVPTQTAVASPATAARQEIGISSSKSTSPELEEKAQRTPPPMAARAARSEAPVRKKAAPYM